MSLHSTIFECQWTLNNFLLIWHLFNNSFLTRVLKKSTQVSISVVFNWIKWDWSCITTIFYTISTVLFKLLIWNLLEIFLRNLHYIGIHCIRVVITSLSEKCVLDSLIVVFVIINFLFLFLNLESLRSLLYYGRRTISVLFLPVFQTSKQIFASTSMIWFSYSVEIKLIWK